MSVADPPTSGRSWPLQSWARYIQSCPFTSGHHRLELAPHFHPPRGCIPMCRWLDPTICWAPQPRLTGVLIRLFVGDWNGSNYMGQELAGMRPFRCFLFRCLNHLEERLLDQAQARASYTPLFWGHSRSIPQGMILDVQPLVKSLFCPIRPSPNGFFDFEASTP